jgi:hypothetical protein
MFLDENFTHRDGNGFSAKKMTADPAFMKVLKNFRKKPFIGPQYHGHVNQSESNPIQYHEQGGRLCTMQRMETIPTLWGCS